METAMGPINFDSDRITAQVYSYPRCAGLNPSSLFTLNFEPGTLNSPFRRVDQGLHIPQGLKKGKRGIRKIPTGISVPLDTCLLMGDP
jgi:hypothetical protein